MKAIRAQRSLLVLPVLLGTALFSGISHADFPLKANDRVVFYGDSITEGRNYTRPFESYVSSRYPERKIRFFNAGWSGDQAGGALSRLERDVLILNPTVVTLCFGMNDGSYTTINDDILNRYRTNMDGIVKTLTDKKIRVIVFSPPAVDYDQRQPLRDAKYNENLAALGKAGSEVAKKYGATYIDIQTPMLTTMAAMKAKTPAYTFIPDAVHPDEKGGVVMGGAMLMGMGAEPMPPLADTTAAQLIGPNKNQVPVTGGSNVPVWLSNESADTAKALGFLNIVGQKLRIRGLTDGKYEVKVNGASAGSYSNSELEAGAIVPGTYSPRARQVLDTYNAKEQNYYTAWRVLRLNAAPGDTAVEGAVAGLMKADDGFQAAIESLSTPLAAPIITVISTGLPAGLGDNLALKKTYVVSDPNVYGYGTGALTDGSWDGGATFATGDKDTFPKTATIDLGAVTPVSHVLLGIPAFGSTKTANVSVSADGTTFKEVGTYVFSMRSEEKHTYAFTATPTRYVRVTYPDHYDQENGYSKMFSFTSEVEVYGPKQK